MALTVPRKYQKVGAAALVLIFALIFFLKLPQSQLNYGRQLEYQAVYETYEKTHVLLARPGSDANFPDPKAIPQDHKNLGRGGVLDDPGIYLLPFVTVPFHIHNPLTGMHWVMIVLGVLTLLQLLIKFLSGSRRYKKSFFILLLIPGILESLNIVPLASSWGATPSNYSLTGELALLVLLNIWLFSKSKRFIGSVGSLALTVVCLYVLVLVRRSAGLEISLVGLFLTFFLTRDQPPLDKKESNPNKWKIRKSNVLQFWPMVAFLAVVFLATSLATQTVSLARSASAQHLTYKEGESNHSFWGVIYTGLGWRPINNGSAPSALGVVWSDTWVEHKLHSLAPGIAADNPQREEVAKREVFRIIKSHPVSFIWMMIEKTFYSLWMCKLWLIVFITMVGFTRRATREINANLERSRSRRSRNNKRMAEIKISSIRIPHFSISILVVLGTLVLISDSLLGAPYQGYLTALNSWLCFWSIYYMYQYSQLDPKIKTETK